MSKLTGEHEQTADRLAFSMMKEVYAAAASVIMSMDGEVAKALFGAVDRRVTDSLQRMVADQTEGSASTPVALALGARLADVLEHAHGRDGVRPPEAKAEPAARTAEPQASAKPITRDEALKVIATFQDSRSKLRRIA